MPTLSFLLYLIAVALAWLLRMSYLGWFGPYFLLIVIVLPLFLLALSLPAMLTLQADCRVPVTAARGRPASAPLTFRLSPFLFPCRVTVYGEIENLFAGERWRFHEQIADPARETASIALPTALCGQLRFRITRLECRDLLGLIRIRRRLPAEARCTVLPPAAAPDSMPDLDSVLETAPVLSPKYGGGYSEEHELREYRPGDAGNSIHWKLSSKTDELIVREALERENDRIFLVLSRVGAGDRGLEVLFWLSSELYRRELSHTIVADRLYEVANESDAVEAMCALLASPIGEPRRFDASMARCIFRISSGEVFLS